MECRQRKGKLRSVCSHKWCKARICARPNVIFIVPYWYGRWCFQECVGRDLHTNQNQCDVSHFKPKTCTTKHLVRERLFADYSVLVAHSASEMKLLVDRFLELPTNLALRSILRRQSNYTNLSHFYSLSLSLRLITINQEPLVEAINFTYLGGTVSSNAKLEKEL